jgi:regulatory protein
VPRRSSRPPQVPAGGARPGRTSAFDAGLRYLARRAHSRAELWRKLLRRGYEESDVEGALVRLGELGYLDDVAFAAGHVRRRSASLGPLALRAELAARGVQRDVANEAIAGLSPAAQLAAAIRLLYRQVGRKAPASYKELLDSAGTKLLRRGFAPPIAREACRAVWHGTSSTPEA